MHTRYLNCGCRRFRDKYEAEISELEQSERLTTEKYNQTKVCPHTKLAWSATTVNCWFLWEDSSIVERTRVIWQAKLAEVEGETERLKVTLRQKDKEIEELKKVYDCVCCVLYIMKSSIGYWTSFCILCMVTKFTMTVTWKLACFLNVYNTSGYYLFISCWINWTRKEAT